MRNGKIFKGMMNKMLKGIVSLLLAITLLSGCETAPRPTQVIPMSAEIPKEYVYIENAGTGLFFHDEDTEELVCISPEGEEVYRLPWAEDVQVFQGFVRCQYGDEFSYVDCEGNRLSADDYAIERYSRTLSNDLTPMKNLSTDLWGYVDQNQKWVIPSGYSYATPFDGPLAHVVTSEQREGFINKDGELKESLLREFIPPETIFSYSYSVEATPAPHFSCNRLLVQHNTYRGYVGYSYLTETGEELPFQVEPLPCGCPYQDAKEFSDGFAAVKTRDKWGYIDVSGKIVIEPQFRAAFPFLNDRAIVKTGDNKYCLIDLSGNITAEIDYIPEGFRPTGLQFEDQIVVRNSDGASNVVDKTGSLLFEENQRHFVLVGVSEENAPIWHFIEGTDSIGPPIGGLYFPACRKRAGDVIIRRFGEFYILDDRYLIDAASGEILLTADSIDRPSEADVVTVRTGPNNFGYINSKGEWIIEPIFRYAGAFRNGIAYVQYGNTAGIIRLEDFMSK